MSKEKKHSKQNKKNEISAGILVYRINKDSNSFEVLTVHPGGPFFKKKDEGSWSIPKGKLDLGESIEQAAIREFQEETSIKNIDFSTMLVLGSVKLKSSGKTIHAFSLNATNEDIDIFTIDFDKDIETFEMEYPKNSGKISKFPEIDMIQWQTLDVAVKKLNPTQSQFILMLKTQLSIP